MDAIAVRCCSEQTSSQPIRYRWLDKRGQKPVQQPDFHTLLLIV